MSVFHKPSNVSKTVTFAPKPGQMFDWDPIIDGLAMAGDMIAPELMPFIHTGKEALKHFLKGKKEKKHHHHRVDHNDHEFDEAFAGKRIERRLTPFTKNVRLTVPPEVSFVHPTAHVHNGSIHINAFDGKKIPLREFDLWKAKHRPQLFQPQANALKGRNGNVAIQDNLREIVNSSRLVKTETIANYAKINAKSRVNENSVPVLQGDAGYEMEMHPVTITKTESHAVIAGSELLCDLSIPLNAGTPGNNIIDFYLNPRAFAGTKLAYEAQTWLQFRFRKFIMEYVPTIGSGQNGAFIAFYTQDPNEQMLNGLAQRRNATEHAHSVSFQPFSYTVVGMTDKPQDKTLYYLDNEAGVEERMEYQGRLLVTNNAQNADVSTVSTYGVINIHYECDFYFPAISDAVNVNAPSGSLNFTGNTGTPTAGTTAKMTINKSSLASNTELGVIFTSILSVAPTNGTSCYFGRPDPGGGLFPTIVQGQTYLLKICEDGGTTWTCYVFDSLVYASQPTITSQPMGCLTIGTPATAGSATWTWASLNKLSPAMVAEISDIYDSSDEENLTQSEVDLIAIKRAVNRDDIPAEKLPTIKALHAKPARILRNE